MGCSRFFSFIFFWIVVVMSWEKVTVCVVGVFNWSFYLEMLEPLVISLVYVRFSEVRGSAALKQPNIIIS